MIKMDELYEVTIAPTTINHFRQFFPSIRMGEKIKVNGAQLPNSSHMTIKYICDFCGSIYERKKYSELRSGLNTNACINCRSKKIIKTCQERYGVNHPMQDFEIHQKSVLRHINNFGKERNDCQFINGIPVSKAQKAIAEKLIDFQLNYLENGYYYDMFNSSLNLVIEYNGKGHDLQVKFGKISQEEFNKRETLRQERIRLTHKLLIINDPYDRLIHPKRFEELFPLISQAVENLKDYDIIQIK